MVSRGRLNVKPVNNITLEAVIWVIQAVLSDSLTQRQWFCFSDNILNDKPERKSSGDKEDHPITDEMAKRMKKADNAVTKYKGKVGFTSDL